MVHSQNLMGSKLDQDLSSLFLMESKLDQDLSSLFFHEDLPSSIHVVLQTNGHEFTASLVEATRMLSLWPSSFF